MKIGIDQDSQIMNLRLIYSGDCSAQGQINPSRFLRLVCYFARRISSVKI